MRTRPRRYMLASSVLLAAGLAGCSSPASPPETPAAHSTLHAAASPSPSSSLGPQAQAALIAYEQAWADAAAVEDGGNYQDPRLEQHLAGKLLMTASEDDYIEETNGIASRGTPVLHPHVSAQNLDANPPTVIIADCIDFRHFIQYYAATGKQYSPAQSGLSADSTTMTLMNGKWMATDDHMQPDNSCKL